MNRNLLSIFICALAILGSSGAWAQAQIRPQRVFVHELEGIWVYEAYARSLAKQRMPHRVASQIAPVVIAIKREGRSYPILITNFDKASLLAVLDVEPDVKPGSYRLVLGPDDRPVSSTEVKYLWFRANRNAQGGFDRLNMAELFFMKGRWADYVHVGTEIGPFINRAVISGRYLDDKGVSWEFTDDGEAIWPDRKFLYELSLNDRSSNCEYFEADELMSEGKKFFGFAWKGEKLQIYPAKLVGKRVRCEAKPLATLTPQ